MILVDTSIWIPFFNGTPVKTSEMLSRLIDREEDICLSDFILMEILQGFKSDKEFEMARKYLLRFPVYSPAGISSYIRASQIYRKCRKQGLTLQNSVDCIIAQTAIENDLILLHRDRDFDRIASVVRLKLVSALNE
jgi:hypothetical protein